MRRPRVTWLSVVLGRRMSKASSKTRRTKAEQSIPRRESPPRTCGVPFHRSYSARRRSSTSVSGLDAPDRSLSTRVPLSTRDPAHPAATMTQPTTSIHLSERWDRPTTGDVQRCVFRICIGYEVVPGGHRVVPGTVSCDDPSPAPGRPWIKPKCATFLMRH